MAADQEQFHQLVSSLLSTDNEIRSQAEATYDKLELDTKVSYLLVSVCNGGIGEDIRQMAAVLLRRLLSAEWEEFFPKLPPESQVQLKTQLLVAIQQEQHASIRKKICEVTAEVARNLIDEDGNNLWPEFLRFLFDSANASSPEQRECALLLFSLVPWVFGNQQVNYVDVIRQMLSQSLTDQANYAVRFQAFKATASFVVQHEKEANILKHLADLVGPLVQVLSENIEKQDDDALLKSMIDMAESTPKYLRSQLDPILQLMLKVVSNTEVPDAWRQMALEVTVTLSETAPAMMRKIGGKYLPTLVPQVLQMMADIEEEEDWSTSDSLQEEDSESNTTVAESALDRISCGLGGKSVLPHIIQNIPNMLANPDWKYRHAALMAVSACGEGCHKEMENLLPQIMDAILNFLNDPHPRVRFAACNAVGQMATDFAPVFEKKFHERVVPSLLMVMDDSANPRVQAHAGAALVNFSEDCPKNILALYLDSIIAKLESILSAKFKELVEKGTKLVLEQVVTTIASVADTSEEKFASYYDRFMPCLKYIIQNATTEELKLLRGKTIECVSLIGLAVGPEKFTVDASEVMDLLLKSQTQQEELAEDDPQISYMISAWARICKILGKRFEQYLPLVMPPILKTASLKPEVALLDNDDLEGVNGGDDWQFVSLGEQQNFGIRTAGLEDKATACQMLVCYARELKEGFADYTEQVVKMMVPMLKFYFHDGVRSAAAESLPCLLECAKIKGGQYLQEMWAYILPELLRALETEPENDVLSEDLGALAKCIELLGAGCISEAHMRDLMAILDKLLTQHFEKAVERQEKRKDEDYDEVVEEQLLDEDDEDTFVLSKVADITHALFAAYKDALFPYFDLLLPHFTKLMGPERPWTEHQWALCIFDDVIEFGGPNCIKYQEYFLRPMIQFVVSRSPEVRQAASYGCGVLGQCGGESFTAACAECIPRLIEVINDPSSRSPENANATENAISAVTKILKYNSSAINVSEILPLWLSWLPVYEDADEAPYVYGYLCDLIEANHPVVLGPNNTNLPRVITILSEAFRREALEPQSDVGSRVLAIVRQLQANDEMFRLCLSPMTEEQRTALHAALTA